MLEIVNYNVDEYGFPCLVVLGCFDGLHIGHAELLKKAKLQAKINGLDLGVMMFVDGKGGKQVYTFEERLKFLEKFNVKFVLKIDYTDEFKKIAPLDFLLSIEDKLNVKAYMSGKDFRFGAGAKGKSSTLKNYGEDEENGVWYMSVKDVLWNDKKVSTTLVKEFLENADLKNAAELLGRYYSLTGSVVEGAGRGQSVVGFPTMNLEYPANKIELKRGVYAVRCTVGDSQYAGIANFGPRPTFDDNKEFVEVYLDGFEGSAYGETVTVEFIEFIREIQKFDSVEELGAQLKEDLEKAKQLSVPVQQPEKPAAAEQPVKQEQQPEKPVEPAQVETVAEEPAQEIAAADAAPEPAEEKTEVAEEAEVPAQTEEDEFEKELSEVVTEEQPLEEVQEEVAEEPAQTEVETAEEQPEEEITTEDNGENSGD